MGSRTMAGRGEGVEFRGPGARPLVCLFVSESGLYEDLPGTRRGLCLRLTEYAASPSVASILRFSGLEPPEEVTSPRIKAPSASVRGTWMMCEDGILGRGGGCWVGDGREVR